MALIYTLVDCGGKGRAIMIFVVPKIFVVLLVLNHFGARLVRCDEQIPFCKDLLENLENDEKSWRENCLETGVKDSRKLGGKMVDSPCCEAEKNYLRERRCKHSQMCFYKGFHSETYLLIRSHSAITAIDLKTLNATHIISGLGGAAMDFNTIENKLYFQDGNSISKFKLDEDRCVEVVVKNASAYSLAIDWIKRRIFWADYIKKQIFVANFDGKKRRGVITTTEELHSIALDLSHWYSYYLFWTEGGRVQRLNLVTKEKVTLVSKRNPGALSLDKINKRVYWQDENRGIFSISYDGLNKMTAKNGSFNSRLLGTLEDSAYFQEVNAPYINQMNISSGEISHSLKLNWTDYLDLVVVHSSLQPMDVSEILKNEPIEFDIKLAEWLSTGNGERNWSICWRATRDGWAASKFHSNCDGRKPTLTMAQVVNNNKTYVFGGYSTEVWDDINPPILNPLHDWKCARKSDIVFVLDRSGSINPDDYDEMRKFLRVVANKLQIGVANADGEIIGQGAMVSFSEDPKVEILLNESRTGRAFLDAVDALEGPRPGGRTKTSKGLQLADREVCQRSAGFRDNENDVKRMLMVITDGEQTPNEPPVSETIKPFFRRDMDVFAVGVGLESDRARDEINAMVEVPENAIFPASYTDLINQVNDIVRRFCPWPVAGTSAPGSFLFSLRNNDDLDPFKAPQKNEDEWGAIYRDDSFGPCFGWDDLCIVNNAGSTTDSWTDIGHRYQPPPGYTYRQPNTKSLLAGSYYFTPSEVEVLYLN